MKWDIDKALADLTASDVILEGSIARVVVSKELWNKFKLNPVVRDPTAQAVAAWCLVIGRFGQPKIFTYALTIRECYLRARKTIQGFTEEQALQYGVKFTPKHKKFERRERKPKKTVESKPTKKGSNVKLKSG
jgi:hypothetical protein